MASVSDHETWETPALRVGIGHALLSAQRPATANELAAELRKDQSNVKKEADRAAKLGLITRCPDPPVLPQSGRRPQSAYTLTSKQRYRAEAELPEPTPVTPGKVGHLQRGQELVVAAADATHLSDLLHVIADAEIALEASWQALCGEHMLFVFDGPDPASPALALLALLDAARIPARRAAVSQVSPVGDVLGRARSVVTQSRATRLRRDTRSA